MYIVLVLIAIHEMVAVLGYDTSQLGRLDSQQDGYLYNLGAQKFLGTESEDNQGRKWNYLVDNPAKATILQVIGVVENGIAYNLIVAISESARGPRSGQYSYNPSLGMINRYYSKNIGIDNRNDSKDHMFVFTAPAYMDTQAFRIFLNDYCLDYSGDKKYVIGRECYGGTNSRIKDQLWVWVNARRYEEDLRNNYFNYENLRRQQRNEHSNEGRYTGYLNLMKEKFGPNSRGPYPYSYGENQHNGRGLDNYGNDMNYNLNLRRFCKNCSVPTNPSSCPYCDNYD